VRKFLLFIFLFSNIYLFGQVVINEVSSAQNSGYADEDGDYPDWIELYNSGTSSVSLDGYKFIRQEGDIVEWTFPEIFIGPGEYLTVFASEKDRKNIFDHWEVPVLPELVWKYFEGNSQPPVTWNLPSFNDATWNSGQGGIGYGDGDDSTVIAPVVSCFLRTSFTLPDTSNIAVGLMAIDYDDGFVAYLNGVELQRNNVGVKGVPPLYSDYAYEEHEAQEYQGGNLEFYFIDDVVLKSAMVNGVNTFSVQVHNYSGDMSDMTARPYLLLGVKDTSITFFPFPVESSNLHTNFNISSSPFRIKLVDNNGVVLDEVIMDEVQTNHSRGRKTDGASEWCIFETPTPDTTNTLAQCFKDYATPPQFTLKAGFYNGSQSTKITALNSGTIRYTVDGGIPTVSSPIYGIGASMPIDSNKILKARLFPSDPNLIASKTTTATYLIDEDVTLPVISLTTNPENLWDYYTGIYVFGPNADSINYPFQGSNFWMGWEKEAHVEYFDRNKNLGFDLDIGLKIHGNYSKSFPQKSFRVLAKDDYNQKWINYNLFPEKPYLNRFKNFNLRNGGIDYNTTHFRDAYMLRVVRDLKLDYMAYEPCVVFLNGEYWGVYGMRERQDDRYIYNNHSEVHEGTIDYLRFSGDEIVGSNKGFLSLANFMVSSDLSLDSNYNKVKDSLDIRNFTDYYIAELYYGNVDWLSDSTSNNIKFWRVNDPVGKWRYVLWDTDLGTGLFGSIANVSYDLMGTLLNAPAPINPHVLILQSIIDNAAYKKYFINRYADLVNTTFQYDRVAAIANEMADDIEPEMARHFNKWAGQIQLFLGLWVARSTDVPTWKNEIDSLLFFMEKRPALVRDHIESNFSLTKQVDITLKVQPEGAGVIKINTIIPDELPWTGVYFDGNPVTITAVANSGFTFDYWDSELTTLINDRTVSFESNVAGNDQFTAHFNKLGYEMNVFPNPSSGTININYTIPEEQQLSVKLFSSDGKEVAVLVPHSQFHEEGNFTITFTKKQYNLAAGTYVVEIKSDQYNERIKFAIF